MTQQARRKGEVAIIIGAWAGIGKAFIANRGRVLGMDVHPQALAGVLLGAGREIAMLACDIAASAIITAARAAGTPVAVHPHGAGIAALADGQRNMTPAEAVALLTKPNRGRVAVPRRAFCRDGDESYRPTKRVGAEQSLASTRYRQASSRSPYVAVGTGVKCKDAGTDRCLSCEASRSTGRTRRRRLPLKRRCVIHIICRSPCGRRRGCGTAAIFTQFERGGGVQLRRIVSRDHKVGSDACLLQMSDHGRPLRVRRKTLAPAGAAAHVTRIRVAAKAHDTTLSESLWVKTAGIEL